MKFVFFYVSIILAFFNIDCLGQEVDISVLESLIENLDQDQGPGAYLTVFKGDEVLFSEGFGYADVENRRKFTDETIFPIASMSKHITAICILKLVEDGSLRLDQKIVEFFPEFAPFAGQVLVSDLLNHTSGLASWPSAATMRGYRIHEFKKAPDQWLVEHGHLEHEAGSQFHYRNTSFFIAGKIVRKVSGRSLAQFAKEELFEPQGLSNTFYGEEANMEGSRLANGYVLEKDKKYIKRNSMATHIGPVGVFTCIKDFMLWDKAIQNNMILSEKLQDLQRNPYELKDGSQTQYAFGQYILSYNGTLIETHGGGDYDWAYKCFYLRVPKYRITAVFFSNDSDLDRNKAILAVRVSILGKEKSTTSLRKRIARKKDKKKNLPRNRLKMYEGTYYSESIDATYELTIIDKKHLELSAGNVDPMVLNWENTKTAKAGIYFIDGMRLSSNAPVLKFQFENDKVSGFLLDSGGANNIVFVKK